MNQSPKSSTVAGLLGIFLGAVGAHNWYLGEKRNGIIHVCLAGAGIVLEIVGAIILPASMSPLTLYRMAALITALSAIGGLLISASGLWGLIEGIMILSAGDAGLARKGYAVATPQPYPQQPGYGYGPQPMQPQQPMQQPGYGYGPQSMQPQQPMQQPMAPQAPVEPVAPAPAEPTAPVAPEQPTAPTTPGENQQ